MSMKTFALKNRLFLIYTAVIAVVVILFSAVLMVTTSNTNKETELYHQQEIYRQNLSDIEGMLWQMDRLATQIISNNEILSCFIPLASKEDRKNYFETDLIDAIRISSLLSSINGTDHYAGRISVFNGNGDYISTGTLYESPDIISDVLRGNFYDTVVEKAKNKEVMVELHSDIWSFHQELQVVSLYRLLSSYTSTVYGLVDVEISTDTLARFPFWEDGETACLLVNQEGRTVYPFAGDAAETDFSGLAAALQKSGDQIKIEERKIDGQNVIVMGAFVALSDWLFVRILPLDALLAPYAPSLITMLASCIALLCCLVAVMYYVASRIAKPLQMFSQMVANVNLQNMQKSIANMSIPYATAEINALRTSFFAMLTRLDTSISMEMQAHMRALQSQMNPHFLFNMLSVIIESSEESGDERTVSMCMKLSAMLRYMADFNGDFASLADELQHAQNYLDLMQDRYEDLFRFEIYTEGCLEHVMLPKMVIQPLAENCFSHGFKNCRPPWEIEIQVLVSENAWQLVVTDNGTGVTDETIRLIHEKVAVYRLDVATNYKNLRLGGMGLVNTLLRLSLTQREQIDFSIATKPSGRGTVVTIGGGFDDSCVDR